MEVICGFMMQDNTDFGLAEHDWPVLSFAGKSHLQKHLTANKNSYCCEECPAIRNKYGQA
jgi:hypothetical protein